MNHGAYARPAGYAHGMNPWLFFAGAAVITCLFYVEGMLLAGRFFGVRVREIGIGVGPLAFTRGRLVVRWLPLGALVYFHDTRFGDDKNPEAAFDHAPRLARVSIRVMDFLVYLVPAFLALGLDAWHSFASGFGQLFTILVAPTAEGVELVKGFFDIVESGDVGRAIGVWFAKSAALAAVPFAPWPAAVACCTNCSPVLTRVSIPGKAPRSWSLAHS
jgi:membrane-associated protease RseP (regulator of RpoE activity)